MKFLKSNNLADGAVFQPGDDTKYLAISIYRYSGENMKYSDIENLFNNGFFAGLVSCN